MVITGYEESDDHTIASVTVFGSGTVTMTLAESCCAEANCKPEIEQEDNMKPNMSFYQTKMHRRKKGGKVSFR